MLTVIAAPAIQNAIQRVLAAYSVEGTVVNIDSLPYRSSHSGLDSAIEAAEAGEPVVMISFLSPAELAKDLRWHVAMSYSNVSYVQNPSPIADIAAALRSSAARSARPEDPLARQIMSVPSLNTSALSGVMHDLNHALHDGEGAAERWDPRWMPKAQILFGDGLSREELIARATEAAERKSSPGHFAGQTFPNAVFDVEGTVLDLDGSVREDILAMASATAKERPVTLATGGDVEELGKKLREKGVSFPLIPRDLLEGASVYLVVDDRPETEFRQQHNISYQEYVQV